MTNSDSSGRAEAPGSGRFAVDELLTDSAENLFASTCGFDAVQEAERAGWAPGAWDAVAGAGFAWIGLAESAGGSGGSLLDAAEVLRIAGANAAPIPLAETAMLGGWLLAEAGMTLPGGPVSVVTNRVSGTRNADGSVALSGTAQRVPWAAHSERVMALVDLTDEPDGVETGTNVPPEASANRTELVVAIDPTVTTIEPATNLAGEPRPALRLDGVVVPAEWAASVQGADLGQQLRLRGALSRIMLMAGALEAMSKLTIEYTEQRRQFGRPISRFQAVQQHLVWGAQDAALTAMTARLAAARAAEDVIGATFEIAAARTVADECAATATRWAHQAHGAMGMTQEYALHHLSRRLWAWRQEWNAPGEWPSAVGTIAANAGATGLYPLIAS